MDSWSRTGFIRNLVFNDYFHKISNADFLFMSSDVNKSDVINGKHFDRILDPIIRKLLSKNFVCISISRPYSRLSTKATWFPTQTINTEISLASLGDFFLNKKSPGKPHLVVDTYIRVLRKVKPKAIFGIGLYSDLCEAARKLGIPIVEVLHGVGYAKVFADWHDRNRNQLPTHVISFDPVSTETFSDFSAGFFEVIPMQKLWTKELLEELTGSPAELSKSDKQSVLFSLTWGYDGDHGEMGELEGLIPNGLFPDQVLRAIELSQDSVNWQFRLHPIQLSKEYSQIRNKLANLLAPFPNAEWVIPSKEPLPILLDKITHHITLISMTAYQAADCGIPSLLLCPTLKPGGANEKMFTDLKSKGLAKVGEFSGEEIVGWIRESSRKASPQVKEVDSQSLENVLMKIISKNPQATST